MITRVIIANNSICPSLMILKMINGGQASVKAKVLSYISHRFAIQRSQSHRYTTSRH